MSHAFAPESMAHCAEVGHRWGHVRAWYAVGWQECSCCGETWQWGSPPPASNCFAAGFVSVADLVLPIKSMTLAIDAAESVAPPSPESPTAEPARYADATPPKKPRPPRAPVGTRPHGGQNRKDERDRQVLALLAAGRSGKEIADHFGLTESRISQIKKNAAVVAAGES